jgi:hypothetical protein
MTFVLLTTGQFVEVAEGYQATKTALSAAGFGTLTVKGAPMDIRGANVIALAGSRQQLDFAQVGVMET